MKKVLVLGAGLVAKPLVRYLLDRGFYVTMASRTVSKAEKMIDRHPNGQAFTLNMNDEEQLDSLIRDSDLSVSLVPFSYHPVVAKLCIKHNKHMVTASYVSESMQQLDEDARAAGVTVLNEIGVDPGIDHMSAMRIIDDVRKRNGQIKAFKSYCGGLPAPEANDNPFGYKFSWAPRGVLLAGRNSARYLLDGRMVEVPSNRLFRDMHVLQIPGQGDYEAYPNRDSIGYLDIYGLQGIQTLFRGTLRNMGWCDCLFNYGKLGLLSLDEVEVKGKTYAQFMREWIGAGPDEDLRAATARKLDIPRDSLPAWNLHWLGMFSDKKFDVERLSPLDAMGELMFEKLAFRPDERDMILLFHDFRAEFPDGKRERIISQLVDFGIPGGDSSMSRTVSLPAAIAVRLILEGQIKTPGVLRPVAPDIYNPVLDELEALKIACRETSEFY